MFKHFKSNEVALLLLGLETVYVASEMKIQKQLIKMLKTELVSRGYNHLEVLIH
jgi:hypothetical protein